VGKRLAPQSIPCASGCVALARGRGSAYHRSEAGIVGRRASTDGRYSSRLAGASPFVASARLRARQRTAEPFAAHGEQLNRPVATGGQPFTAHVRAAVSASASPCPRCGAASSYTTAAPTAPSTRHKTPPLPKPELLAALRDRRPRRRGALPRRRRPRPGEPARRDPRQGRRARPPALADRHRASAVAPSRPPHVRARVPHRPPAISTTSARRGRPLPAHRPRPALLPPGAGAIMTGDRRLDAAPAAPLRAHPPRRAERRPTAVDGQEPPYQPAPLQKYSRPGVDAVAKLTADHDPARRRP
jgi:hypothetical protein